MYNIAQVIYGVPLVTNDDPPRYSEELQSLIVGLDSGAQQDGWLSYYSGDASQSPLAFGFEVGEFDVVPNFIEGNTIAKIFSPPQSVEEDRYARYTDLLEALPESLREEVIGIGGEPRTFILWCTS